MTLYSSVFVLALTGIIASCSGSQFAKSSATTANTDAAAAEAEASGEADPITSEEIGSSVDPGAPSAPLVKAEDKTALDACLKQWTTNPFSAAEKAQPQIVEINETVNNNTLIYSDKKVSTKPALFLVNFNISVGNNGELEFLNPMGWYCFNVKAKVINNFLIKTACQTKVAIIAKQAQNDKNFTIQPQPPCP